MNEYDLLKELSKFPNRKDDSGRCKIGRAIVESDIPYLDKLYIMGYINIGFDYKSRENTLSITKKGINLVKLL